MALNYEDLGKETLKNKKLNMESELALNKIKEVVEELKRTREEIEAVKVLIENRQTKILTSIKKTINSQLAELLPEGSGRRNGVDEEEMVTSSQASSISDG